jgi:diguanylate cyclase (GGDEF)-like protein
MVALREHVAAARAVDGCAADAECCETERIPSVPRACARAAQGTALALGAPAGWVALQLALGQDPAAGLPGTLPLYLYMFLGSAVAFIAFGASIGRHEDCLLRANRTLDELSVSDPVTGLRNARYFRARLREEQARAARSGKPLSIVAMDLDHFKHVNDRYGHPVGDEVLVAVSRAITAVVRTGDTAAALQGTAARMGGEEFALLLPETNAMEARAIAERVRQAVRQVRVAAPDGSQVRVTISCGVASGRPSGEAEGQAVYAAADAAMYRAKQGGRNRTCVHGQDAPSRLSV